MTSRPLVGVVVVVGVVLVRVGHANRFTFLLYAQLGLQSLWCGRGHRGSPAPASPVANHRVQFVVSRQRVTPRAGTRPHDRHLKHRAVPLNYRPREIQTTHTASSVIDNTTTTTTTTSTVVFIWTATGKERLRLVRLNSGQPKQGNVHCTKIVKKVTTRCDFPARNASDVNKTVVKTKNFLSRPRPRSRLSSFLYQNLRSLILCQHKQQHQDQQSIYTLCITS